MPLTPQVTLTATLTDISGNDIGTVSNPATLEVVLCGFGPILPCVPGTCNIDQIEIVERTSDGAISILLWGNDVIYPLGTFYQVTLRDGKKKVVQSGAFQFIGSGSRDLSSAAQISPGVTSIFEEAPSGTFPGTTYLLSKIPINGLLLGLFLNAGYLRPGIDYSIIGRTLTTTFATQPTDSLSAVYAGYGVGGVILQPGIIVEQPAGAFPGNSYTISAAPLSGNLIGLYYNGGFLRPTADYTLAGTTITTTFETFAGDNLYAVYIAAS